MSVIQFNRTAGTSSLVAAGFLFLPMLKIVYMMLKINYNENIENNVKQGEVMKQSGNLQNNLVVLRAEKRWSQTDLANQAGVSRQTIASIEANRYNPSLILAFEIALILGKEFHEVFQYKIEGETE